MNVVKEVVYRALFLQGNARFYLQTLSSFIYLILYIKKNKIRYVRETSFIFLTEFNVDEAEGQQQEKREMKSLSEILKPLGLSKTAYYQLKYRGFDLPASVGVQKSGGRPEKLYYPEQVISAIERSRARATSTQPESTDVMSAEVVEEKIRKAFATPVSTREAMAALGVIPGSQQHQHYDLVMRRMIREQKILREGELGNRYAVSTWIGFNKPSE